MLLLIPSTRRRRRRRRRRHRPRRHPRLRVPTLIIKKGQLFFPKSYLNPNCIETLSTKNQSLSTDKYSTTQTTSVYARVNIIISSIV